MDPRPGACPPETGATARFLAASASAFCSLTCAATRNRSASSRAWYSLIEDHDAMAAAAASAAAMAAAEANASRFRRTSF